MSRNQRNKRLSDVSLALLEVSSLPQVEKTLSDPDEDTATPRTCCASLKRRGSVCSFGLREISTGAASLNICSRGSSSQLRETFLSQTFLISILRKILTAT